MTWRARMSVAAVAALVIAGATLAAGSQGAVATRSGNLVFNGSFERGSAGGPVDQVDIPGWDMQETTAKFSDRSRNLVPGYFTVIPYGTRPIDYYTIEHQGYPTRPRTAAAGSKTLFVGPYGGGFELRQHIDLSGYKGLIDSGKAYAVFSADVGIGPGSNKSQVSVGVGFGPVKGAGIGLQPWSPATGAARSAPVMELWRGPHPPDRYHGWTEPIPKGVRYADVLVMNAAGWARSFWQCGFVDDVRLELTTDAKAWGAGGGAAPKATYSPRITVTPSAIEAGGTGKLAGTGWKPLKTVTIEFGRTAETARPIRSRTTDRNGTFVWWFDVGPLSQPGRYVLVVCQESCALRAQAVLTVKNPAG